MTDPTATSDGGVNAAGVDDGGSTGANATETGPTPDRGRVLYALRVTVYSLAALVALSLLAIGTVAVIAELKGSWHWQIHLETTVAYIAVFVSWLLAALVPLAGLLAIGRWRWEP